MKQRLFTASRSTPARNIMLAEPQQALVQFLQALGEMQAEVQANMIRAGFIPVGDEKPPTIVLSFDVMGMPEDKSKREAGANGQQIV